MEDLEEYLKAEAAAGELESSGGFTLDWAQAAAKLSAHQLGVPGGFLLKAFQAVNSLGCDRVDITLKKKRAILQARFGNDPPELESLIGQPDMEVAWRAVAGNNRSNPCISAPRRAYERQSPALYAILRGPADRTPSRFPWPESVWGGRRSRRRGALGLGVAALTRSSGCAGLDAVMTWVPVGLGVGAAVGGWAGWHSKHPETVAVAGLGGIGAVALLIASQAL